VAIKTIMLPNGKQAKAQEVPFQIVREEWSEYNLQDGTVVRLRTTAAKIMRILDENGNPAMSPEGDPLVFVVHRTDVISSD
jgi:hypothetical protein